MGEDYREGAPAAYRPILSGEPWLPNHWSYRRVPIEEAQNSILTPPPRCGRLYEDTTRVEAPAGLVGTADPVVSSRDTPFRPRPTGVSIVKFSLFLVALLLPLAALAQSPAPAKVQIIVPPGVQLQVVQAKAAPCDCGKKAALGYTQDDIDFTIAMYRGMGSDIAIGKYRYVTLAVRQYMMDKGAGRADAKTRFQAALAAGRPAPNPARKCNIATLAVAITPVMIEMMDPTMPPAQLAEIVYGLELAQAIACGTPVPPPPVPTPTNLPHLAPPAESAIPVVPTPTPVPVPTK